MMQNNGMEVAFIGKQVLNSTIKKNWQAVTKFQGTAVSKPLIRHQVTFSANLG